MRKGNEIIGLPIYAYHGGKEIAQVKDIFFDQYTNKMLGLFVDTGGWFSNARLIPWEHVFAVGPDAVVVRTEDVITLAENMPGATETMERDHFIEGTKILTTDGKDLGTMNDIYFDTESGRIEGYEVTGGLFADAYTGRSFMPAPKVFTIGKDAAFVPPETADMMDEQVGGIKGKFQEMSFKAQKTVDSVSDTVQSAAETTGEKLSEAQEKASDALSSAAETTSEKLSTAKDKASEALDSASETLQDTAQTAGEKLGEAQVQAGEKWEEAKATATDVVAQQTVEQARGRRVRDSVRTKNGVYIATVGQIVTDTVIDRAKRYGQEEALLSAVGMDPAGSAQASLNDSLSNTGDSVRSTTQNVWETVKDTATQVKDKLGEIQERSVEQVEQERIQRALGRPVTRVILDKEDNVILDTGDIITHEAVDRARSADTLGILLSSVHVATPELSSSALRANETGSATLATA